MSNSGFTTHEVAEALASMAQPMQDAWEHCLNDDAIWRERAQRHGRLWTWWLRWMLKQEQHIWKG